MTSDRGDSDQELGGPVALVTDAERMEGATDEAALASGSTELVAESLGEYTRVWLRRVRSGESGVLPVVLGLIAIVVYFQIRNSLFLSAINLANLITQAAFIVTFGMAEVFVLLLGEIDLSVGYNGACGAVITLWALSGGVPWSSPGLRAS
jgi:D-xylose transport system permease protein